MTVCTLSNWVISAEIIFSLVCILCSTGCWIVFFNLPKLKYSIETIEKQIELAQIQLVELETKIKFKKPEIKEILLNPQFILKIIELVALFKAKKLSKLLFLKTIFVGK